MRKWTKVQVGKIDLDTVGAAYLLGVSREDEVEVLSGQASEEDLANPHILCIEVGGSGRVSEKNFDHHGPTVDPIHGNLSATLQVARWIWGQTMVKFPPCGASYYLMPAYCLIYCYDRRQEEKEKWWESEGIQIQICLTHYIDILDRRGADALGFCVDGRALVEKPFLSDVFYGMLLIERNPVEQLHRGIEILREVVARKIHPFGQMPVGEIFEWATYAKAKAENDRRVAEATKRARWGKTSSGLTLAWLETDFIGAPGALYGVGAQVVVVYSPHFGPAKVPKFTVAGNGVRVDVALPVLNAREPGWGGPASGTIIGSPREGSSLSLQEVVRIVQEAL